MEEETKGRVTDYETVIEALGTEWGKKIKALGKEHGLNLHLREDYVDSLGITFYYDLIIPITEEGFNQLVNVIANVGKPLPEIPLFVITEYVSSREISLDSKDGE